MTSSLIPDSHFALTLRIEETARYYNFSNIRYAQPPIGNPRFAPSKSLLLNRTTVKDGQGGRICIQGIVQWAKERTLFVDAYYKGMGNVSSFTNVPSCIAFFISSH